VRGGAQQSNTSANTKSSRNTAIGLAAAGVVTAGVVTAATVGGVLWYNKKNAMKKDVIDQFIFIHNLHLDDICKFYDIVYVFGQVADTFKDLKISAKLKQIYDVYGAADTLVQETNKFEFDFKQNTTPINENNNNNLLQPSYVISILSTNSRPIIRLEYWLAYFRLRCFFASYLCYNSNEWVLEQRSNEWGNFENRMMVNIHLFNFLEWFLSLYLQFKEKLTFEFFEGISRAEKKRHNDVKHTNYKSRSKDISNEKFNNILESTRSYDLTNTKIVEMQKRCVLERYYILNEQLMKVNDSLIARSARMSSETITATELPESKNFSIGQSVTYDNGLWFIESYDDSGDTYVIRNSNRRVSVYHVQKSQLTPYSFS
jgi:hypothetical protein